MNASALPPARALRGEVPLPHPLRHPMAHLRSRVRRWWHARLPPSDQLLLTQRNVYILPTRAGWMLGATLLVLLIASINYQLNLGYLLTFLLAGSALVGMHLCHGTLRGLTLQLQPPDPLFAGSSSTLALRLASDRKTPRRGIGVSVSGSDHWAWADVPAQGSTVVHAAFHPQRRGLHPVPMLSAETRYPLGTFRVWTLWRPASQVMVYPAPDPLPPPLPPGEPRASGAADATQHSSSGEFDGVRAYRRGDPLKLIVWKKAAKSDELVSRDTQQSQRYELWLDSARTGLPAGASHTEAVASRLCAWVLLAERNNLRYGLRLGPQEIRPATGEAHKRRCLEALALATAF